jgi:hypothetical protein
MVQVVACGAIFRITTRMVVSIKVSAIQKFTFELREDIFSYPQLDFHVWMLVI